MQKKYLFLFILWVATMFVFNYLREGIPELFWVGDFISFSNCYYDCLRF